MMKGKLVHSLKIILNRHSRGQGLIETALLFPVLLVVLSGLLEFGLMLNEYLAIQDAARNAARFAADGLYYARDTDHNCGTTRDFNRQVSCLVNQELAQERPEITLNLANGHDDIIVSAFSISAGTGISSTVTDRHPQEYGDDGWSEAMDALGWGTRNQSSQISSAEVNRRLFSAAPSTGLVLVEIFYDYEQKLKLPWITAFIDDPHLLHAYAIMPLVSAEPTPTPIP
jgi:hypothetical protein